MFHAQRSLIGQLAQWGRWAVQTSAPSSIVATAQTSGARSGSNDSARSRSDRVTEVAGSSTPLTALASTRVVSLMQSVWNEMRLAFHVVARPDAFHGSYLERNHAILDALVQRGGGVAAAMLRDYLDEAEGQVLAAYRGRGAA